MEEGGEAEWTYLKEGRKERNKKKKKKSTQLPGRATVLQPLASEADECEVL